MIRHLVATALFCSVTAPAIPEHDPDSARAVFLRERHAIFAAAPIATAGPTARRGSVRGSYRPDPTIIALVDRVATEVGVAVAVMREHVRRESGFRPGARNPKSTATGLLQVIKGSHEAIIGRKLTMAEHIRLSSDPEHSLRVGAAHMRACMDLLPGANSARLYGCHYHGHARFGGRIEMAAAYYRPDPGGWLARGSVAMPWSRGSGSAS